MVHASGCLSDVWPTWGFGMACRSEGVAVPSGLYGYHSSCAWVVCSALVTHDAMVPGATHAAVCPAYDPIQASWPHFPLF